MGNDRLIGQAIYGTSRWEAFSIRYSLAEPLRRFYKKQRGYALFTPHLAGRYRCAGPEVEVASVNGPSMKIEEFGNLRVLTYRNNLVYLRPDLVMHYGNLATFKNKITELPE